MQWHAQVTSLSLRGFANDGGRTALECFESKLAWMAACKAEILGGTLAYVHLASRKDGAELSAGDWRAVARLLRDEHGVQDLMYHRGDRLVHQVTSRA